MRIVNTLSDKLQFVVDTREHYLTRINDKLKFVGHCSLLLGLIVLGAATSVTRSTAQESAGAGRKPQDVYLLGPEAKLGVVTFSHVNHVTKNRNRWLVSSVITRPNPFRRLPSIHRSKPRGRRIGQQP